MEDSAAVLTRNVASSLSPFLGDILSRGGDITRSGNKRKRPSAFQTLTALRFYTSTWWIFNSWAPVCFVGENDFPRRRKKRRYSWSLLIWRVLIPRQSVSARGKALPRPSTSFPLDRPPYRQDVTAFSRKEREGVSHVQLRKHLYIPCGRRPCWSMSCATKQRGGVMPRATCI